MPVGRILLKAISDSNKLSKLSTDGARLLYTWLIPHLDVNGCFSADPVVIKGRVFTRLGKSIKEVESYLDDMEGIGLIKRFTANGDIFLIIPNFKEKQPSLRPDREGKTSIPLPTPDQLQSNSGPTPAEVKLNEVNINKDLDRFLKDKASELYESYPRKADRKNSLKSIEGILKAYPGELLPCPIPGLKLVIQNYRKYLETEGTPENRIIQSNNFFGQAERWRERLQPPRAQAGTW